MGQGNSQRRVRHQDIELWELYGSDDGDGGRGQRRTADRSSRSGSAVKGSRNENIARSRRDGGAARSNWNGIADRSSRDGNVVKSSREENIAGSRQDGSADRSSWNGTADRSNWDGTVDRNSQDGSAVRSNRNGTADRNSQGRISHRNGQDVRIRRDGRSSRENGRARNNARYDDRYATGRIEDGRVTGGGRRAGYAKRNSEGRKAGSPRRDTSDRRAIRAYGQGDASQISYIQPYPDAGERRRKEGYRYKGNARPVQSIKRRRARRRRKLLCKAAIGMLMAVCLVMVYFITGQIYQLLHRENMDKAETSLPAMAGQLFDDGRKIAPPEMTQDFLEINEYSRPGTPLNKINNIFVHYTANPGTSAAQNRSYFSNLAETHERSASAHLIIGYEGELIQCIPFDEQAYAVMTRNEDSISIECCYLSEDGSFTQETYDTLIHTLAWLLDEYGLSTEDILRHYDCGGKLCPLYYAENEGAWEQLRQDVADYMAEAVL